MQIKGIVAGVGDKANNQNVITPDFDANIIDFMVGGSAIVEGLGRISSGTNLTTVKGTTTSSSVPPYGVYATDYITINVGKNAKDIQLSSTSQYRDNYFVYNQETGMVRCILYGDAPQKTISAELSWYNDDFIGLTKGIVVHKGYRGELLEDIEDVVGSNIYAQYVLNNNENVVDEFYIEITNAELPAEQTIGFQKIYNLLLYSNGIKNPDLYDMPATAYHSLTCDKVLAGGTIDSEATGVTQNVNDNSLKIATTEYVENMLFNKVNYGESDFDITYTTTLGNTITIGNIYLQRKSKQVICKINLTTEFSNLPANFENVELTQKIPTGFTPKNNIVALIGKRYDYNNKDMCMIGVFGIEKTGIIDVFLYENDQKTIVYPPYFPSDNMISWEIE